MVTANPILGRLFAEGHVVGHVMHRAGGGLALIGLVLSLSSCLESPPEAPRDPTEAQQAPAAPQRARDGEPAAKARESEALPKTVLDSLEDAVSVADVAGAALRSLPKVRSALEGWIKDNGEPRAATLRARVSELPPGSRQAALALADDIAALTDKIQAGAPYDAEAARTDRDVNALPAQARSDPSRPPVPELAPQVIQLIVRDNFERMRVCAIPNYLQTRQLTPVASPGYGDGRSTTPYTRLSQNTSSNA